jgi:phospholipid-binding lipoprotein MlaA
MIRNLACLIFIPLLAACTPPEVTRAPLPNDPYEATNRSVHEFNKRLDRAVLRPLSQGAGDVVPRRLRKGVSNFASNLSLPGIVLNDILQGKVEDALHNTTRFLVNSTFGIGGLNDVAQEMGVNERYTNFGQTLGAWGMSEGAYLEVPFKGPTTEREFVGTAVDFALDPTYWLLNKHQRRSLMFARIMDTADDRYSFGDTYDSILYESADSYAATRDLYLQNHAYSLGETTDDDYIDPYE